MNQQVKSFLERYPDLREVTLDRFAYTENVRKRDLFNSDNGSKNACRVYDVIGGGNRRLLSGDSVTDDEFLDALSQETRRAIGEGQHIIQVGLGARLTRHPLNGARLVYCPDNIYEPEIASLFEVAIPLKSKLFKQEAHREVGVTEEEEKQIQAAIEKSSRIKFRRAKAKAIAQFVLQNKSDDLENSLAHGRSFATDLPVDLVEGLGLAISNFQGDSNEQWQQRVERVARSILDFRIEVSKYLNPEVLFLPTWWDPKEHRKDDKQYQEQRAKDRKWIEKTRLDIGIVCRSLWLDDLYSEIEENLRENDHSFDQIKCSIKKDNLSGQTRFFLYPPIKEE